MLVSVLVLGLALVQERVMLTAALTAAVARQALVLVALVLSATQMESTRHQLRTHVTQRSRLIPMCPARRLSDRSTRVLEAVTVGVNACLHRLSNQAQRGARTRLF